MSTTTTTTVQDVATQTFAELGAAWNAAEGHRFAAPFAPDADFVNIRGEHFQGRETIAHGHEAILGSIYAGSTVEYRVESVRPVDPTHAVVVVGATLDAPHGPLAGVHRSRITAVLVAVDGRWLITSFHNTLCADDVA